MLRGFSHHTDVSQLFQRPTQVLAVPNVTRGHIIPGDNTSFTTTFEFPFRESFGISGNEVDSTSGGDAKSSRFTLAMRMVIRATFSVDFLVDADGRSVLKEAEMLCSERPEAFGEPSTYQCSASALEDVRVGTLNDRVILRNSSSGLLVHNSKGSAGKLKLRGIVGIKFVNGITYVLPKKYLSARTACSAVLLRTGRRTLTFE